MDLNDSQYKIVFSSHFDRILKNLQRKNSDLLKELKIKILKIAASPILGKPLRNVLRNYRRAHLGSFVLIYEIKDKEVRFLDFDHHDNVYKKHR